MKVHDLFLKCKLVPNIIQNVATKACTGLTVSVNNFISLFFTTDAGGQGREL